MARTTATARIEELEAALAAQIRLTTALAAQVTALEGTLSRHELAWGKLRTWSRTVQSRVWYLERGDLPGGTRAGKGGAAQPRMRGAE